MRHAITKMSHFHFTAAESYRRRVIQLGESPDKVFNYGAPGLENIAKLSLLERDAFEKAINFKLGKLSFLVTYHPVTLGDERQGDMVKELFKAIDHFPEATILFTKANADTDGRIVNQMIAEYVRKNTTRAKVFISMGQLLYLSAIKNVDIVIGNSSSGIVEVPTFKKPTVNIGKRQKGRLRSESIIDCEEDEEAIVSAIGKGISTGFIKIAENSFNRYKQDNTSIKIKEYLKSVSLKNVLMKRFYDVDYD